MRLSRVVGVLAAVIVMFPAGTGAQVYFGPGTRVPTHNDLWSTLSADFDHDGVLDLVVVSFGLDVVSLLRGRGDGTFDPGVDHAVGNGPGEAVAADLDEDGSLDLAVANSLGGDVSVLRNDGFGSFGPARSVPAGGDPNGIIAEDLDGDGHLDLGVTIEMPSLVALMFGDGLGGFSSPRTYAIEDAFYGPLGLAAGDFNGDSVTDIAVGTYFHGAVMWGDGAGSFVPMRAGFDGFIPVTADMDGDGLLDLVVNKLAIVEVIENDGAGGFDRRWCWDLPGHVPWSFAVADFDEDGLDDVAAAFVGYSGTGAFGTFLTDASGGRRWLNTVDTGSDNAQVDVDAGDFDGDGHVDLVLTGSAMPLALRTNRTFALIDLLEGNVNAAAGAAAPVLFVNGSTGTGSLRPLALDLDEPLTISIAAPPSRSRARFVLYAWKWWGYLDRIDSFLALPFDLGVSALPTPLTPNAKPQPLRIANTIGRTGQLGVHKWPGPRVQSAPTTVLDLPGGFGRGARLFFQGLILDSAAPNGIAAVTNGVDVHVP